MAACAAVAPQTAKDSTIPKATVAAVRLTTGGANLCFTESPSVDHAVRITHARLTAIPPAFHPPHETMQLSTLPASTDGLRFRATERRSWSRKWPLALVWVVSLAMTSGMIWALSWYQPQPPVNLVLLGAGYQENLAVPHNSCGWRGLCDLEDAANNGTAGFHVGQSPSVIDGGFEWSHVVRDVSDDVVIVMSAHGAADDKGPYLLPNDFNTVSGKRVRLEGLWQALEALPTERNKLVVFDVTQIAGDWRLGFLENGFVRALASEQDRIESIPKLTVICSSNVDERSWIDSSLGRTVFMHYLQIGLQGRAIDVDRNGRISAVELHAYLRREVGEWVTQHRGVSQLPLMLPHGQSGETRARRFDLAIAKGPADSDGFSVSKHDSFADVRDLWANYERLLKKSPNTFATGPTYWREYVDTLLRCEQLHRVGDQRYARRMQQRLAGIEYRMKREQVQAHASLQNSLSLYKVTQSQSLPHVEAMDLLEQLWAAAPDKQSSIWQSALKNDSSPSDNMEFLRLAILEALFNRAAEDPQHNLQTASQIVEVVRSPLCPVPAEIHFLQMLAKYLPKDAMSPAEVLRIQTALKLRRLAEQAAVGHHDGEVYAAEQVLPWITHEISAGDAQRRLGEDLLFAGPDSLHDADGHFELATQHYEQAVQNAQRVEEALQTRDRVLAELPYYSQWLADAALDPYVANSRHEDALSDAEKLWQLTHELVEMLQNPDERWIASAPPATTERPQPLSLVDTSDLVAGKFQELVNGYQRIVVSIAHGETAAHWHTAERALGVPHGDSESRMRLLEKLQSNDRRSRTADVDKELTPAMTDAAEIVSHRTNARVVAMTNARWQGRMAMALLGKQLFAELGREHAETFEQVRHRLNVFSVEDNWWHSTGIAASEVYTRSSALPDRISLSLKRCDGKSTESSRHDLATADRWARVISGAQASQLSSRPSSAYRRVVLQDLAVSLAERTLADHWYALDPKDDPYYRYAGLAYLNDAQRLRPDPTRLSALRQQVDANSALQFSELEPIHLTSQRDVQLQLQMRASQGTLPKSGFPVTWLQSGRALELLHPLGGTRMTRRFDQSEQGGGVAIAFRSQHLEEAEKEPGPQPPKLQTELTVHGFFRGQVLDEQVPVTLHLKPEIAQSEFPFPDVGAISLTADASVTDRFGTGDGAIAFALDCSGSMGPAQGVSDPNKSKYADAVNALREVLTKIPRGTRVSLWTFGEATASGDQSPEASIRQLQRPIEWDPNNPDTLRTFTSKVDPQRVRPWNESPIVRTILAAKGDLEDAKGFRTIVVITDGMDNRFAHDQMINPGGLAIPEALRKTFAGTGIALNVIAFKVADGEEEKVQDQFAVTEQLFPPGRLYHVNQTEALAKTMANALGHRMHFQICPSNGEGKTRSQDIGGDQADVWPKSPLPAGSYQLQVPLRPPIVASVKINPGDVLALALKQAERGLRFDVRHDAMPDLPPHRKQVAGPWRADMLQNQISSDQTLRLAMSLSNIAPNGASVITQTTPRHMWIEVEQNKSQHGGIRWQRLLGFPAAAWSISVNNWPASLAEKGPAQPRPSAWWSSETEIPYCALVKRNEQRPAIEELAQVVLSAADEKVTVESVAIEDHYVTVRDGRREKRSCLAVRLKSKPGSVYWADLKGMTTDGAEQRFYPSIGSYTGLFWPVTQQEAERALLGLGIVSLDNLKREAESQGNHVTFDSLASPDANDFLPTPLYSFE